jgi:glycosyltransferase involved in cell wall biosynthesis
MDDPALKFSVVVISWNQKAFLERLIGQLIDQDYSPDDYEIIVVDDGSTDGSREWLNLLSNERVKTVFGAENRGRSASRNAGIRAARGEIIVMIDGDHTVPRNYLSVLAERHAKEYCVIVGKSDFADNPESRALNTYLNRGGAAKLPVNERLPGRYFLTRSCSVPRDLLLKVGLFDEAFRSWGGEDLDLGIKLERTGVPIYGESRCRALHHHFRSLNDLMDVMFVYGRDSIPILLKRHPQLFRELNLHRALKDPFGKSQGNAVTRAMFRILMLAPIYEMIRAVANGLRRHRLPRVVFDYLHLRQYTRGYQATLRSIKGSRNFVYTH